MSFNRRPKKRHPARRSLGWIALGSAAAMTVGLASGCPGELENPDQFLTGTGGCDAEALMVTDCTNSNCHNAMDMAGDLDLETAGIAARVNGVAGTTDCDSRILADPSNPLASLLYVKLTDSPGCGSRMPIAAPDWTPDQMDCLEDYIVSLGNGSGGSSPSSSTTTGGMGGMGGAGGAGGNAGGMGGATGGSGGAGGS